MSLRSASFFDRLIVLRFLACARGQAASLHDVESRHVQSADASNAAWVVSDAAASAEEGQRQPGRLQFLSPTCCGQRLSPTVLPSCLSHNFNKCCGQRLSPTASISVFAFLLSQVSKALSELTPAATDSAGISKQPMWDLVVPKPSTMRVSGAGAAKRDQLRRRALRENLPEESVMHAHVSLAVRALPRPLLLPCAFWFAVCFYADLQDHYIKLYSRKKDNKRRGRREFEETHGLYPVGGPAGSSTDPLPEALRREFPKVPLRGQIA